MLDTPQITQTTDQLTAVTRLTIPREEVRKVMGPGIVELMAAVAAQGVATAGPWFSLRMDPNTRDFKPDAVGFVSAPLPAPKTPTEELMHEIRPQEPVS